MGFLNEFWAYMKVRKKFWLLPVFMVMILLGGLLVLTPRVGRRALHLHAVLDSGCAHEKVSVPGAPGGDLPARHGGVHRKWPCGSIADNGMQFDLEMWKYARDVKVVSPDPLIGHEHGPDRKAHLMGVDVETNSKGQRDREIPYERTPGVLRIAMIGDFADRRLGRAVREHLLQAHRAAL